MHTAEWDDDHDLTGERVAVIGSAASAVQLLPEVAKARRRTCTCSSARRTGCCRRRTRRSPPSSSPASPPTRPRSKRSGRRIQERMGAGFAFVDEPSPGCSWSRPAWRTSPSVTDARLRAALTPDDAVGLPAAVVLQRLLPDVQPARTSSSSPTRSSRITPTGVVTADGVERGRSTRSSIATGFETTRFASTVDDHRHGRAHARAGLGRRRAGLPRRHDVGLPEPVPALRPEHQPRLDHLHDRMPGGLHRAHAAADGRPTTWRGSTSGPR